MLRTCLLTIGFFAAYSLPASANMPVDMGSPLPTPPKPQPVREKTKKQVRDGQDTHAGDDAKVKPAPKEKTAKDPSEKQHVDK